MLDVAGKSNRRRNLFSDQTDRFLHFNFSLEAALAEKFSKKTVIFRRLIYLMKNPLYAYGNAVVVSGLVVLFRYLLIPYIGVEPPVFQLFDFAVFASALVGGFSPGIFATIILCLASRIWFFDGSSNHFLMSLTEGFRYYTFLVEGIWISGLSFYLRKMFLFVDDGLISLQAGLRREDQLRFENQVRKHELESAEISRAKAVASLKESEEHLLLAISSAEMGTWDVAVRQNKIHFSKKASQVFGGLSEAGDCDYQDFLARIHPEDLPTVRKSLNEILSGLSKAEFVLDFRTQHLKDGIIEIHRDRWLSVRGRVYFENGKPVRLIGIVVDVTARQEAHEAVLRLKNEAEQSNFAKTRFLANISHEIRTPLGAILGFAELMLDPSQNEGEREDCLHTILRNGESLRHVIDDILDVVTLETERLTVHKRVFSIRALVEDLSATLAVASRKKGIELEFNFDAAVPDEIQSDPLRLRQILENVVGNAIKFTSVGRVSVEVGTCLSTASMSTASSEQKANTRSTLIEFKVTDTGVGMSEDQHRRVFQMFSQGNSAFDRQFGGSGLGLFLSRRLAQELGGDLVLVESRVDKGSVFLLRIDTGLQMLLETETPQLAAHSSDSIVSPPLTLTPTEGFGGLPMPLTRVVPSPLGGMKVLIVDDAPDNCILIARYLRKAGAETQSAENGLAGMSDAQSHDYDVVLMDLQMPVLDGYKAIESLREAHYDKPIVAITAHALKGERERCLNMGADEFLQKPVDRGELIRVVEQYRHSHAEKGATLLDTVSP